MKTLSKYLNESLLGDEEDLIEDNTIMIKQFLEDNYDIQGDYNIHDGIVDFSGNYDPFIRVKNKNLKSLTGGLFKFGKVEGEFSCNYCSNLKTLEGAPEFSWRFECSNCTSLKSLEGAPDKTKGLFICSNCTSLKSLEGAPSEIGGSFYCSNCTSLKSLKDTPKIVGDNFDCSGCSGLTTLEGVPSEINGSFNCSNCMNLKTLKGAPENTEKDFYCDENNSLKTIDLNGSFVKNLYIRKCANLETVKKLPERIWAFTCSGCPKLSISKEEVKSMSDIRTVRLKN